MPLGCTLTETERTCTSRGTCPVSGTGDSLNSSKYGMTKGRGKGQAGSAVSLVGTHGLLGRGPCSPLAHSLAHQVGERTTALDKGVQGLLYAGVVKVDPRRYWSLSRYIARCREAIWVLTIERLSLWRSSGSWTCIS